MPPRRRIEDLLARDAALRAAFAQYEAHPKPVDLIVNFAMGRPAPAGLLSGKIEAGLTLDDVLRLLYDAGYRDAIGQTPICSTIQLVSPDHELRDGEFVLRRYRVLDR